VATDGGQIYRRAENLNDVQFNQYRALSFKPAYMVFPMLVHAKSRGRVSLKSTDYRQHPLIEANFLDDPIDVLTLIEASKICLKIGEAPAFKRLDIQ
jgi:choline dehydrogenase-like flavoprotein